MKTFKLVISTPDGDLFSGEAVKVSLRGTEGELAVLANHIPFITSVKPCTCRVEMENGEEKRVGVEGGLLSVGTDVVTLMSGSAKWE
ncbi:MAG: F0F1 ATP synthase subunit epsilon [Ruminococcaceae bacterium]|nr:F0F1 ATP synthase subunit epsilon [Oscillospiraceae bacterium]